MSPRTIIGIVIGLAVLVLLNTGLFVVPQSQQAIVLQLGSANRIVTQPGLGVKVPFLEDVMYFDKKVLSLDVDPVRRTNACWKSMRMPSFGLKNPCALFRPCGHKRPATTRPLKRR
jgi:modulator of FtsH protease HflC